MFPEMFLEYHRYQAREVLGDILASAGVAFTQKDTDRTLIDLVRTANGLPVTQDQDWQTNPDEANPHRLLNSWNLFCANVVNLLRAKNEKFAILTPPGIQLAEVLRSTFLPLPSVDTSDQA